MDHELVLPTFRMVLPPPFTSLSPTDVPSDRPVLGNSLRLSCQVILSCVKTTVITNPCTLPGQRIQFVPREKESFPRENWHEWPLSANTGMSREGQGQ